VTISSSPAKTLLQISAKIVHDCPIQEEQAKTQGHEDERNLAMDVGVDVGDEVRHPTSTAA
jgi:hypothetical protein